MKDKYEAKWWADHYVKAEAKVDTLVSVVVVLVMVVFGLLAVILTMIERF